MSLSVDLWKIHQDLEDSLNRLQCLKECHLQEYPSLPLPDFVFPLQKVLQDSLLEIHHLQQVRPQVRQALQELVSDPQGQVLMEKLAQAEAAEWKARAAARGWAWVLGLESAQVEAKVSALVQAEEKVEVLEPGQDLDWLAQGPLTDL
jgi:hypothetical protein